MTQAFADCAHMPCSYCGVPAHERCLNKITNNPMTVPHWHRIVAADKAVGTPEAS